MSLGNISVSIFCLLGTYNRQVQTLHSLGLDQIRLSSRAIDIGT